MKLDKKTVDRRIDLLREEGIEFITNANVGVNVDVEELREANDAIVLCCGATTPRDLPIPGRDLEGIHFAMEYLPQQNRRVAGDREMSERPITAKGKRVIILGGGDTGADCHGTALRQGARSVDSWELLPKPPH